jgi:hypothetical protein
VTWVSRCASAVAALFLVLVTTGMPAWAGPAPLPSLAPGQVAEPSSWDCTEATSTAKALCEVRSWAPMPAPESEPVVRASLVDDQYLSVMLVGASVLALVVFRLVRAESGVLLRLGRGSG